MKAKVLLVSLCLLIGTSTGIASSKSTTKNQLKKLVETSCKVSVVTGKYKVSITATCTCTRRQACDKAYAIAGFLL